MHLTTRTTKHKQTSKQWKRRRNKKNTHSQTSERKISTCFRYVNTHLCWWMHENDFLDVVLGTKRKSNKKTTTTKNTTEQHTHTQRQIQTQTYIPSTVSLHSHQPEITSGDHYVPWMDPFSLNILFNLSFHSVSGKLNRCYTIAGICALRHPPHPLSPVKPSPPLECKSVCVFPNQRLIRNWMLI